jgi:4-hydroxy-4-methyl-2-oxoglutarate aldolase
MSEAESRLTSTELRALRRFNTPTIANAIELFNVRPRHTGFLPHYIRCLLPELGPIVGYAVTSKTRAAPPEPGEPQVDLLGDYFRYVASRHGPKIAVGQDLDDPPGLGAQFGEVTATIHNKLGCVGHITSGCPRDLDEVRALGFQLFGLNPCVSHAYVRLVEFGTPVTIGGVEIHCGDLIHADKHGVCLIPHSVAHRLAAACAEVERRERPLLEYCTSDDFSLDVYIQLREVSHAQILE